MDNNDKISNIPVSELTPENINTLKKESGVKPVREKKVKGEGANHRLALVIVGAILLIGVGVALFFIFRQPTPEEQPKEDDSEPAEIVWAPSEETDAPAREYIDSKQAIIDSSDADTDEKLDAQLSIINLYSVTGAYQEAEDMLNAINRDTLTYRQLFNLYSAYEYLYEHSGNEAAQKEYSDLVDEVLGTYWDEETPEGDASSSEDTGE